MKEITPEMINLALMYLKRNGHNIKRIKVTSAFADKLEEAYIPTYLDTPQGDGMWGSFTGIPVVIDDTIENEYYELVY